MKMEIKFLLELYVIKLGTSLIIQKKIVVTAENQKTVSMFWNSLYFLDEEKANLKMSQSKAEYGHWLFSNLD